MAQKLDVFLYGSCVSRDLQEMASSVFYRRTYIARQSLISATTPPYVFADGTSLNSAWQHRMVLGDLESNLLTRLAEDGPRSDLVVWDLTDERHGVQPLGDGSYGTITPDSLRSGILEAFEQQGSPIPFGDPDHLALWSRGLECLSALLEALGLRGRTYVLAPQWAGADRDGEPIDAEAGRDPEEWAAAFAPYVAQLQTAGYPVLPLPEEHVRTHSGHRWGPAPYHYVDEAYRHWAGTIEQLVREQGGKRPQHAAPPAQDVPGDPEAPARSDAGSPTH